MPEDPIRHGQAEGSGKLFGQFFGLDPRVAVLAAIVDSMLFGGEVASLGAVVLLSVPAGIALGWVAYKAQRRWYGDDHETALIKASIVGLLTAIPTPLPVLLAIPAGLLGVVHGLHKRLLTR
jgi:hypothetical protein